MRLAHKRNIQRKLKKAVKVAKVTADSNITAAKPNAKKVIAKTKSAVVKAEKKVIAAVEATQDIKLTPKQQSILDIVAAHVEGINSKDIGLEAGQEEAKAAAWATGGLKKLLEEDLVIKEQAESNKVMYKLA
ncbi:MarR family transcriptional regulator [Vibrio sp. S17_S38]|uniref:MarR family transcriptional regulator n=1 Tax=Vibrio sp. S17_S38 TaxID=2720229 RepID=UPI00167FEC76|nr:MarR family transcriptional regulator [Vibrio sp. S17_S38]MBD1574023.1 MarR family transcriptional regulator [Vibrio sp. S17_S38]